MSRGALLRLSEAMSALTSSLQNQAAANAADPSMEEILASIRRIIADDHGTPINPRPSRMAAAQTPEIGVASVASGKPAAAARADLPRLRSAPEASPSRGKEQESTAVAEPPVSLVDSLDQGVVERLSRLEPAPARGRPALRQAFEEAPQPQSPPNSGNSSANARKERLDSSSPPAESSFPAPVAESLLSPLARASVSSAFEALTVSMAAQNGSVVEEAVRDMLRPMLKQWLDENLPTIVERLVRAEIERVGRGGRS